MVNNRRNDISKFDHTKRIDKVLADANKPKPLSKAESERRDEKDKLQYIINDTDRLLLQPKLNIYKEHIDVITLIISKYFRNCYKHTIPPTISGLGLELGMSRDSLYKISTGMIKCASIDLQELIKKAYWTVERYAEQRIYSKHVMGAMFWLKSHGWQGDDQKPQVNINFGDILRNVKEGGEDLCCVECNSPNWDNLKQFIQEEIKRAVIEYDTNVISTHIQMSSKKKHIPLIENILESRKQSDRLRVYRLF